MARQRAAQVIVLVLTFCLVASPLDCHDIAEGTENPQLCMLQAQTRAIEWLEDHPKWRLRDWRCVVPAEERRT